MLARLATANELLVNSHHHQAVDVIGHDLVAAAWASDGVVEAMEDPRSDRFVVAVQWHPELGWKDDTFSQKLFKRFVDQARSNVPDPTSNDLVSLSPVS
jgi:putative glutamine amidotransferase